MLWIIIYVFKEWFAFETCEVTIETEGQRGVHICPDLAERKGAVLEAAGLETFNIGDEMRAAGIGFLLGDK